MLALTKCWRCVSFMSCFFVIVIFGPSQGMDTFVVSFQSKGTKSIDHWMKYNKKIGGFGKEFSACHWERVRFFSLDINSVWAYCFILHEQDNDLKCLQFNHRTGSDAGRKVDLVIFSSLLGRKILAYSIPFRHRQWNHICFTYSSLKKLAKFYYNGKLVSIENSTNFTLEISGKSVYKSSFIVGQEPDKINGGFSSVQLFNGDLSELNIWRRILSDEQIVSLSQCHLLIRGDIISWEQNNFDINEVKVIGSQEKDIFCKAQRRLVIFPQRQSYKRAQTLCKIHGGKLTVPLSRSDDTSILHILSKHKRACLQEQNVLAKGHATWLGMERYQTKWYSTDTTGRLQRINYTNWDLEQCTQTDCGSENFGCPYMEKTGLWAFGFQPGFCLQIQLCPICSFDAPPVFSIKGMCSKDTLLNWNFYMDIDENDQIVEYEGYKTSKLTYHNDSWQFEDNGILARTSSSNPIGRKYWNYKDRTCELKEEVKTLLTFSVCYPGKEFTCNSGDCIALSKRCNQIEECDDGSDEKECFLVDIPSSYSKILSPGGYGKNEDGPVSLTIKVNISSVDSVDEINMRIGITFDLQIEWSDDRLTFINMDTKRKNKISVESSKLLWLPSENIIHENAVVGEVIENNHRVIRVENLTEGIGITTTESVENYKHLGSKTRIVMVQRNKIIYSCTFHVTKFPFDAHRCYFKMKMEMERNNSITFVKGKPTVIYSGPVTWNQFEIHDEKSDITTDKEGTGFVFSIGITRVYMNQVLNIFLPTILLWCLAYFTLFIQVENFSDRFMGCVTALLVLVSLISSANEDLPKTSYFKFIDLWFLWHIASILSITLFHIFINHIQNNEVESTNLMLSQIEKETKKHSLRFRINRIGTFMFAAINILFEIMFYVLQKYV